MNGITINHDEFIKIVERTREVDMTIAENLELEFICGNAWINVAKDISLVFAKFLEDRIRSYGLIDTIDHYSEIANRLLRSLNYHKGFYHTDSEVFFDAGCGEVNSMLLRGVTIENALLVLRYAKRMSKGDESALYDTGLDKFKTVNQSRIFHIPQETYFYTRMKEIYETILPELSDEELSKILSVFPLSPGTTVDAGTDKYLKYSILSAYDGMVASLVPFRECDRGKAFDQNVLSVRAVPKNYKTPRIIGVRDVVSQARCYQNAAILATSCRKAKIYGVFVDHIIPDMRYYCPDPQAEIKTRIIEDSGDTISTIDLTSASDSISWAVTSMLYPEWIIPLFERTRPRNLLLNYSTGRRNLVNRIAKTSGDADCFKNEEVFILGSIIFATEIWVDFSFTDMKFKERNALIRNILNECRIYGDDISVPNCIVSTLYDVLTSLGLIPNPEKSFSGDHPYREACGAEVCNHKEVKSFYFPRANLFGGENAFVSALVKHQHGAHLRHLDNLSNFLRTIVLKYVPNMTFTADSWELFQDLTLSDTVTDLIGGIDEVSFINCSAVRLPYGAKRQIPTHDNQSLNDDRYTSVGRISNDFIEVIEDRFKSSYETEDYRYEKHLSLQKRYRGKNPSQDMLEKAECLAYREFLEFGPLTDECVIAPGKPVFISRSRVEAALDALYGDLTWR